MKTNTYFVNGLVAVVTVLLVVSVCRSTDILDRDDYRWRRLNGPWSATVHGLAIDPADPNHIIAASSGGVFHSYNGGISWVPHSRGMTDCAPMSHIRFDPSNPDIILMTGSEPFDDICPVYRSEDGGESWTVLWVSGQ